MPLALTDGKVRAANSAWPFVCYHRLDAEVRHGSSLNGRDT